MLMTLTLTALVALTPPQQGDTDTTFAVPNGTRLQLQNMTGDVVIGTWDRNEVRVIAEHSRRTTIEVDLSGSVLRLRPRSSSGMGLGGVTDYQLTIPVTMAVDVSGMSANVTITGSRAEVKVGTVSGDIRLTGGVGSINLTTIDGGITVRQAKGRMQLRTASDQIEIEDSEGDINAEAVSGDIRLRRVNGRQIEVQAVSGDVEFEGAIQANGSYYFGTHSGDLTIAIPENANVMIRASASMGDFTASFALPASEQASRRRQTFRLGNGSASMEVEVFSGDIALVRPSELRARNRGEP